MTEPQAFSPDIKDEGNGLLCFLNMDRECGPACMAYLPTPPEGRDYENQQWANCHVLVNMQRAGKHLVVLAQVASTTQADRKRVQQPSPPTVR